MREDVEHHYRVSVAKTGRDSFPLDLEREFAENGITTNVRVKSPVGSQIHLEFITLAKADPQMRVNKAIVRAFTVNTDIDSVEIRVEDVSVWSK